MVELRTLYPNVTKDRFKLRDGGGLFLLVEPTNARGWRFNYRRPDEKTPNTISLGIFPEVTLSEARDKCDAYRKLVAAGKDPSENKEELRRTAAFDAASTVTFLAFTNFEVANAAGEIVEGRFWKFYMNGKRKDGSPKCFATVRCEKIRLRTLQQALGHRPMKDIDSGEIQAVLDDLSDTGHLPKAVRVQQLASRIFDLAVARRICKYNVAAPCKKALNQHFTKKLPAVTDHIKKIGLPASEVRVGALMRHVRDVKARLVVRKALEMMALTFPRPSNIVLMEWDEIEGDMWTIPEHKMKMREIHKVPLSSQALAILEEMRPLTGRGKYVFPTTKNTLTRALANMGYDTETEQSTHGFRSIASTLLSESGEWSDAAVERQLAHKIGGKREKESGDRSGRVAGIYNKSERMVERQAMMQWWGDYLERLRDGNVVSFKQAAE
jgi:integrase